MEKKLSNIVKWYDSYLEYLSIVGKQLTKIEKNHLEYIHNNGLVQFFNENDLDSIVQRILNDLLTYPELWNYFDYSDDEKELLQHTITFDISNENYQKIFDKIIEENNEVIFNQINNMEITDVDTITESNINFVPNAYYTISNNMSLEIEISNDGSALRIKDNDFISDWLEIDYKIDEYSDDENDTIPYVNYGGMEIDLNNVMRLDNQFNNNNKTDFDINEVEDTEEEPDFRRGQKVTNGIGKRGIITAINWDEAVLEVSVYYDNGPVNDYDDEWDFNETEILTDEYLDEDEVEYDSMDDDEILRNYVHFVNWAQMQLDNPNSIDWYSLTEEKYNKLLESVYSLNQGIECVDMLDILRVINNA